MIYCPQLQGLQKLRTEQVFQALHASLTTVWHSQIDEVIDNMKRYAFLEKNLSIGYVNNANYIQKALETKVLKSSFPACCLNQLPFEVPTFFYLLMFGEDWTSDRMQFIVRNYKSRMSICVVVYHVHPGSSLPGRMGCGTHISCCKLTYFTTTVKWCTKYLNSWAWYACSHRDQVFCPRSSLTSQAPTKSILLQRQYWKGPMRWTKT